MPSINNSTIRRGFATPPQRILVAHPADQRAKLGLDPWPAAAMARLAALVGVESASMPANHGLRFDDDDRV
jgi:hypothetical protein